MKLLNEQEFMTNERLKEIFSSKSNDSQKRNNVYDLLLKNRILYNKELERQKNKHQNIKLDTSKIVIKSNNNDNNTQEQEIIDVSYYLNQLEASSDFDNLGTILPHRNNVMYYNIINTIIVYYLKECNEYEEILANENLSLEEKDCFRKEIEIYRHKINKIINYRDSKDLKVNDIRIINNLIYLPTILGNYYVLNDIKSIDYEYYASFLELLNSIIDGTFKNVKSIINNNKINYICEVKDFKTRVFFSKINFNTYLILGCMVKKVDTNSYYNSYLENRSIRLAQFLAQEQVLTDTYLEAQNEITKELIYKLEVESRKR